METVTTNYFKRSGVQINTPNQFSKNTFVPNFSKLINEPVMQMQQTEIIYTYPKTIISKVENTEIGLAYSLNPYQGCENGCLYCYSRNTHENFGYNAGLDFERKIIVKKNAAELLEKEFSNKNWKPQPIMLSGNTDCYQPIEKELQITRNILKVCLKYKHPISIITKNVLIIRDIDILSKLAELNLVHVMISITGIDEKVRLLLEPKTPSYKKRMEVITKLSRHGIPCGVMMAPVIPGINHHEIPKVIERAANAGATNAKISIVKLNGTVEHIFKDWLIKNFPERANKIWNQISSCPTGKIGDNRKSKRIKDEGAITESIMQLFNLSKAKFIKSTQEFKYKLESFNYRAGDKQLSLF